MRLPVLRNVLKAQLFLQNSIRQGADLVLAMRIGFFWGIPRKLATTDLPRLLSKLRTLPASSIDHFSSNLDQVSGFLRHWLWIPILRSHNTCYVRAITLYRFLDFGGRVFRIHLGIEPAAGSGVRLRGHASITVDEKVLDAPGPLLEGRVREIYVYTS